MQNCFDRPVLHGSYLRRTAFIGLFCMDRIYAELLHGSYLRRTALIGLCCMDRIYTELLS